MTDEQDLETIRAWPAKLEVKPFTVEELARTVGAYRRLGHRPNESEGLRFLATALEAMGQSDAIG